MSLTSYIGSERNILEETPQHCHTLKLPHPILTNCDLEKLRRVSWGDFLATTLPMLFAWRAARTDSKGARSLCRRASLAIRDGYRMLILSDRGVDDEYAPIPSLLALTAVHNHLVRENARATQVALIIESGEPREVMHFALLMGYGASAVNPYLAIETLEDMAQRGPASGIHLPDRVQELQKGHQQGTAQGLLEDGHLHAAKLSRRADLRGHRAEQGADRQVFHRHLIAHRRRGLGRAGARSADEARARFPPPSPNPKPNSKSAATYQYRVRGEHHLLNPLTVSKLQHAVRERALRDVPGIHAALIDEQNRELLHAARPDGVQARRSRPCRIEEVEPAAEIVKRFATGAMSFGSISKEAHETLAIAMNRIGGRSNTGEGGEDEARFKRDPNGDWRRSAIKQVASATLRRHHAITW